MSYYRLLILFILITACGKHETRRPLLDETDNFAQDEVLRAEVQALRYLQTSAFEEFFTFMKDRQIDINYQFENGRTFLIEAVIWSQTEIVKWLLNQEECDLEIQDREGLSAIDHAKWINNPQVLALFQSDAPSQDEINQRLFQSIAAQDYSSLQESLSLGAELNIFDQKGMTPLITAIYLKDEQAIRILLQTRQADVNLADKRRRWTPLTWSKRQGLSRVSSQLERLGAEESI